MATSLKNKIDPYILDVIGRLRSAGYETYLVGGAVRDILLDRTPKDYDVSTSATPEEARRVFRDRHTLIIGRRFRLVHLIRGRDITEISTFRKRPDQEEQADRPKRCENAPENMIFHDNSFGTSRDDAFRRDFTVNAIFYDPVDDRLVDHTGLGVRDLRDGIVRTIGDPALRFEEDPVRVLRAIKLVGQYGFAMEPETGKAVRASIELIEHASPSRLSLELEKILRNSYTGSILKAFHDYGFLRYYLPELDTRFGTPQMDYALALLGLRGERIRSGIFRASLSTAVAMVALPFAEDEIGRTEPGGLWEPYYGVESDLRHLVLRLFSPLVLTHRTTSDTVCNLIMQPRFFAHRKLHAMADRKGYPGAREFAIIQNLLAWRIPAFEDSCPLPVRTASNSPKRRRPPRRRHGRGDRNSSPDASGGTEKTADVPDFPDASESGL